MTLKMLLLARRFFNPMTLVIRNFQVTILGAANEIGQTVCLLLRAQPNITKLVLHDSLRSTPGILLDVSHVPSDATLVGFSGDNTLDRALKNADIVVLTGGATAKPGMTKNMNFSLNSTFIRKTASRIARCVPMPFIGIATEPINSMVPMAAEIMRNHGEFDPKKLFGITTIELLRAQCLYASEHRLSPRECFIPVIGGHSNKTTVPLLSQARPYRAMDEKKIHEFTSVVQKGEDIVTKAKRGLPPTLSVAYSVLIFVRGILDALQGYPSKVNAFVENNDFGTAFFSGLVAVTQNGAGEMQLYNNLSTYECHLLERSIHHLRKDIIKGQKVLEAA